jgi:hypothetical protein
MNKNNSFNMTGLENVWFYNLLISFKSIAVAFKIAICAALRVQVD